MLKLNSNLRKALAVSIGLNGKPGIMDEIEDPAFDFHGLTFEEYSRYLDELKDMGLVSYVVNDDEDDLSIFLTSEAECFFRDSKVEVAKTVGRYLFQLLVGASGGLVVLLIGNLLTQ